MRKCVVVGGSVIVLSSVYFLGIKTGLDLIAKGLMDKVLPEMAEESIKDFVNALEAVCER